MADEKIRIDIETSAETGPVEDYQDAYEALKSQVEEAREKLVELAATPDVGADTRKAAAEEVAELEEALKKADAQLQKSTAEAKKNERATESAADAVDDHAEALNRATQAADDGVATLEELTEWLEKKEAAEKKSAAATVKSGQAEDVTAIKRLQQGEFLERAAGGLGEVSVKLRQSAAEIGNFNNGLGNLLDDVGKVGEAASDVVGFAAKGFAVGGPWGAAIGGIAGLLKNTLGAALSDTLEAIKEQGEAEQRATDALKNHLKVLGEVNRERGSQLVDAYQDKLENQLRTLGHISAALAHQNDLEKIRQDGARDRAAIELEQAREADRVLLEKNKLSPEQFDANELARSQAAQASAAQRALDLNNEAVEAERLKLESAKEALEIEKLSIERQKEALALSDEKLSKLQESKRLAEEILSPRASEDGGFLDTLTDAASFLAPREVPSAEERKLKERAEADLARFNEEVGRNQKLQAKIKELSTTIKETKQEVDEQQRVLTTISQISEAKNEEEIKTFEAKVALNSQKFEAIRDAADTEVIEPAFATIQENSDKVAATVISAGDELKELGDIAQNVQSEISGVAAKAEAEISDKIQQGADDVFKPIIPLLDEKISATGEQLSEQGQAARDTLERLANDQIDDNLQRAEFVTQLQTLQREGIQGTQELLRLTNAHLQETQNHSRQINNLWRTLDQIRSR